MNGRYSRCSSNISDYVIDIKKDNMKCQITPKLLRTCISDLHQPAFMQMNRRNLLIKFTFFVSQEPSQGANNIGSRNVVNQNYSRVRYPNITFTSTFLYYMAGPLIKSRRRPWTIVERYGCSVFRLTSLFCTW